MGSSCTLLDFNERHIQRSLSAWRDSTVAVDRAGKQFRLEVTSFFSGTTSGAQAFVGHKGHSPRVARHMCLQSSATRNGATTYGIHKQPPARGVRSL